MLKTKVKASSITNLTDARYFAAWEVEWLGFDLDPNSEFHVTPSTLEAIRAWVDGVRITGEFNMQDADEIREAVQVLTLDAVQAGPLIRAEVLAGLDLSVPLLVEVIPEPGQHLASLQERLEELTPFTELFVLEMEKGGWTWDRLQEDPSSQAALADLAGRFPLLLGLDVPPASVEGFLQAVSVEGLSVRGGAEEKVGYKSFEQLDELFEALEVQV